MTQAKNIENHDPATVATDATATDPQDQPFPPRYWWLKRILAGVGLVVVGLVLLRLVWGWDANRRLQAEIDSYIAAGEPIHPEDFDPPEDIPDDQNAAKFLMDAGAAVTLTPEQVELISKALDAVEAVRADADALTALVQANAQALSLVRQARTAPGVDWGIRLRRTTINTRTPWLFTQYELTKLLCATAVSHGLCRNESDVFETLHDALAQSEATMQGPTLTNYSIGVTCRARAIATLEYLGPMLGTNDGVTEVRARVKRSARALALALLDEDRFRTSFVQSLLAKRCSDWVISQSILDGSTGIPWLGTQVPTLWTMPFSVHLASPLLVSDTASVLKGCTAAMRASRQPGWPQAQSLLPPEQVSRVESDLWFHPLRLLFRLDWLQIVRWHFRSLARSRMAAASLAIRLYESDYGRRPSALSELVPAYLEAVPLDPFALKDELRYLMRDDGAVLYSVGSDGGDNRGAVAVLANGFIDRSRSDIVFHLDGLPTVDDDAP